MIKVLNGYFNIYVYIYKLGNNYFFQEYVSIYLVY